MYTFLQMLDRLVLEGMAWVDIHAGKKSFFFMSMWLESRMQSGETVLTTLREATVEEHQGHMR